MEEACKFFLSCYESLEICRSIVLNDRHRFAGSEEGIFEFTVNLRDRMTFPAVEFR